MTGLEMRTLYTLYQCSHRTSCCNVNTEHHTINLELGSSIMSSILLDEQIKV